MLLRTFLFNSLDHPHRDLPPNSVWVLIFAQREFSKPLCLRGTHEKLHTSLCRPQASIRNVNLFVSSLIGCSYKVHILPDFFCTVLLCVYFFGVLFDALFCPAAACSCISSATCPPRPPPFNVQFNN